MSKLQLVRHPAPMPDESLQGYFLRLAEQNGHRSVRPLLNLAGATSNQRGWTTLNLAPLAEIVGCPVETLMKLAYKYPQDDFSTYRIMGHEVLRSDLSLGSVQICPQCIDELGYIEASWNLELFLGCPIHARPAAYFCPHCRKRLSGSRRGLLICRCGATVAPVPRELAPEVGALLDFIRYTITGKRHFPGTGTSFMEIELAELPMKLMLCYIRSFGKLRLKASGLFRDPHPIQILHGAAKVFADWPNGYRQLVSDANPRLYRPEEVPVPENISDMFMQIAEVKAARFGPFVASW